MLILCLQKLLMLWNAMIEVQWNEWNSVNWVKWVPWNAVNEGKCSKRQRVKMNEVQWNECDAISEMKWMKCNEWSAVN
jgi:hypothetical protein